MGREGCVEKKEAHKRFAKEKQECLFVSLFVKGNLSLVWNRIILLWINKKRNNVRIPLEKYIENIPARDNKMSYTIVIAYFILFNFISARFLGSQNYLYKWNIIFRNWIDYLNKTPQSIN